MSASRSLDAELFKKAVYAELRGNYDFVTVEDDWLLEAVVIRYGRYGPSPRCLEDAVTCQQVIGHSIMEAFSGGDERMLAILLASEARQQAA